MIKRISTVTLFCFLFLLPTIKISAQDKTAQYPFFLTNHTYFGASVGYISYDFSNANLAPGYTASSIHIPHAAVRLILYGYRFNKYLSAQVSYMRPVNWIQYKNVNGDHTDHSVTMNISGVTVKSTLPIGKKFSAYAEAGFGIVTRTGFKVNNVQVISNTGFATLLSGATLQYHPNKNVNLMVGGAWSPASAKNDQPSTLLISGGISYNMHRLSAETVKRNSSSGYFFPKSQLQVGYSTNVLGYHVNNFLSNTTFPVFWGGDVQVANGVTVHYQRNVFHGRKTFSFDWGTSFAYWKSNVSKESFFTLSVYPYFRLTPFHFKSADLYFFYSVAGPTYISKFRIDNTETGKHFTFQDYMGIGMYAGKSRKINAEINVGHYSNGDIFPQNNGIKVPLTFNVGYTFGSLKR